MPVTTPWYYARQNQQLGPVAEEGLRALITAGQVAPTDLAWREGMPGWVAVAQTPEFALMFRPAFPAAPQPVQPVYVPGYGPGPFPPPPQAPHDPATRWLIPVDRSGWAIAAGYLGLLSPLLIFAPFAILTAALAFADIRKNPAKCGRGRAIFGLILGVMGCFGLLLMFIGLAVKH